MNRLCMGRLMNLGIVSVLDHGVRHPVLWVAASSPQNSVPLQLQQFLEGLHNPHNALFWVQVVPMVLLLGYMLQRYLLGLATRPEFNKQDVVYQEYFASGSSYKNFLTKLGGANNCLRLVVTNKVLWITSWFPFSLLAALYDLEHVVPLNKIVSLETSSSFGKQGFLLTFSNQQGNTRVLRLRPKRMEEFVQALEPGLKRASSSAVTLQTGPIEPSLNFQAAIRKYWHHLLVIGLFPTVFFVGCSYFKVPFGFMVPVFFASAIYGHWPITTRRVPYMFQFVLGAVWLGGGIFAGIVTAIISAVFPRHP